MMCDPGPSRQIVCFGAFQADLHSFELRKSGIRIKIQEQPFRVLQILLEHPGEMVRRDELQRRIWPSDTFVDFDRGLNNAVKRLREALGDSAETPRYIETLARRGYRFIASVIVAPGINRAVSSEPSGSDADTVGGRVSTSTAAQSAGLGDRIAVFPLVNPDESPETEYLLSGIPGSIIRGLSSLPGLTVVAGGIVTGDGNREGNARTFGRKFGVGTALLGRLLQRRTKLRLQVDLVDTKTGEEFWADQYDRDFAELVLVEENIVKEVSQKLRLKLTGEDRTGLTKRYTEDAEAYQFFLRGRHSCESRSVEGFRKALEYLKQAIRLDPRYALAYSQIATCLSTPIYYGLAPPQESCPAARAAAAKALELDDGLAEAHEVMATLNVFDWRWSAAEGEYKRSVAINPNHAVSRYRYAMCLAELGRFPEAINEAREAQIRDPLSGTINAGLAWTLWAARHYDEGLEQAVTAVELDPNNLFARVTAGVNHDQKGNYEESIAQFQKGIDRNGGPMFLGFQGHAYARSGDKANAWNNIHKLQELSKSSYVPSAYLAITYAGLDEKDFAIQSLQTAHENHDIFLVFAKMLPQFDNLRSDSRFDDLLRRMNFPP